VVNCVDHTLLGVCVSWVLVLMYTEYVQDHTAVLCSAWRQGVKMVLHLLGTKDWRCCVQNCHMHCTNMMLHAVSLHAWPRK